MQCIVGAVLDSLSSTAQEAVTKVLAAGRSGVGTRRNTRGNAEAEAAQKLAQSIVQWIDEVDQEVIEEEVLKVVHEQEWLVTTTVAAAPAAPAVSTAPTAPAATGVTTVTVASLAAIPPYAPPITTTTTTTTVASPQSPVLQKRKAACDGGTPGSVTRSASKAQRCRDLPGPFESACKPTSRLLPTSTAKTPSYYSSQSQTPRAATLRPTFLHGLGAKIPAFPSLLGATTATAGAGATPSRAASSSAASGPHRSPLKAMPLTLQQQILHSAALRNSENNNLNRSLNNNGEPVVDRASKWMRPQTEKTDLRSAMEKQLSAMRMFLNTDQDNNTVTETMDITGFRF